MRVLIQEVITTIIEGDFFWGGGELGHHYYSPEIVKFNQNDRSKNEAGEVEKLIVENMN